MILVDDKLVLFFSFKIPKSTTSELYDLSLGKSEFSQLDTAIEESTYLILKMGTDILRVERQSDIESKNMEKFLFRIKKDNNFNYLLENPSVLNFSEYNTESLNNKLWKTINSIKNDSNDKMFINEDYFLSKNDIIKFGNIKYIVKEISSNLKSDLNEIIEFNIDFCPSFKKFYNKESKDEKGKLILCDICNNYNCDEDNPLIKFCSCNYIHYECLKTKIEINSYKKEKEKVSNYYINNLKCKTCDFIFPLRFKLANKKFELINIEIPSEENTKYIILESIEKKIFYGYMKLIHVIQFDKNEDIINIGRNKMSNDMVICDPSISKEHAQFIYQENTGKILLKNLSKKFGSSVFIKNAINIGDKRMQIQIGKILFETQRMKFGEFDKNRKRRKTKYPLPSKY